MEGKYCVKAEFNKWSVNYRETAGIFGTEIWRFLFVKGVKKKPCADYGFKTLKWLKTQLKPVFSS